MQKEEQTRDREKKANTHEEIGRTNNSKEKLSQAEAAKLPVEIGLTNPEPDEPKDEGEASSEQEVGVVKNEQPGKGKPGEPEIGRIRNEPPSRK